MLPENKTWPFKENDEVGLERNSARMLRCVCDVRSEDMIFAVELKNRLQLISTMECLQNMTFLLFGRLLIVY